MVHRSAAAVLLALLSSCSLDRSSLASPDGFDAGPQQPDIDSGARPDAQSGVDGDGDGVLREVDCDDADVNVGRTGSRSCASGCGEGTETCTDGVWSACDAPTDCACTGDGTQTIPCGRCGMQTQRCVGGEWTNEGACTGEGVCTPGATDTGSEACGTCGTQMLTRTCTGNCAWGDWATTGACMGGGICSPGQSEMQTVPCGNCGTRTETRTCTSACTWGDWVPGTCTGEGECAPGSTETMSQACGSCDTGTRTGTRACTGTCTWSPLVWGECMNERDSCQWRGRSYCHCVRENGWTCCDGDWSLLGCSSCP